jgi:hypothetical protein
MMKKELEISGSKSSLILKGIVSRDQYFFKAYYNN